MKPKVRDNTVVQLALVMAAGFFSIPFVAHYTKVRTSYVSVYSQWVGIARAHNELTAPSFIHCSRQTANFTAQKDPLNSSQIRRGAYLNSGSRDAGAGPDWDLSTGTYHGRRGPSVKRTPSESKAHGDD